MADILTTFNEGIQSYWDKIYSCNSFNQMWILPEQSYQCVTLLTILELIAL
jgi:hypothetical protein